MRGAGVREVIRKEEAGGEELRKGLQGRCEGRVQGRGEGRVQGRCEGRVQGRGEGESGGDG